MAHKQGADQGQKPQGSTGAKENSTRRQQITF
jgi:hypothetical protein